MKFGTGMHLGMGESNSLGDTRKCLLKPFVYDQNFYGGGVGVMDWKVVTVKDA